MKTFAILALFVGACLHKAISTSTIDCSGTEIHTLVVTYDIDGSGTINDTELLTMCLNLGLPLESDEATGVVTKYGGNTGELTDAELCNYLNTLLTADSTNTESTTANGKSSKGKNYDETFNPTPGNLHPTKKPSQERRERMMKSSTYGKDFTETFNPTPEDKHPTKKPSHERRAVRGLKHSGDETFNPTPGNLHPTKKPQEQRKKRSLSLRGSK